MTAVNETQLGLDHNRQNCNPLCASLESQIHKYINKKAHAHMGIHINTGTYVPFLFLSNTHT